MLPWRAWALILTFLVLFGSVFVYSIFGDYMPDMNPAYNAPHE